MSSILVNKSLHIRRLVRNQIALRYLSKESSALTDEQKDQLASADKVERFKKYIRESAFPKTFSGVQPSGRDIVHPKNPSDIAALSGVPLEHANRTVIIVPRQKKTLQSGMKYDHQWYLMWKVNERWSNPLMGWTSTADPMSQVRLKFDSAEAAINYAKRQGWKYEVSGAHSSKVMEMGYQSYADNFLPRNVKARIADEGGAVVFGNPNYGKSNWFMPLKYHGDGEVEQFGPPQNN